MSETDNTQRARRPLKILTAFPYVTPGHVNDVAGMGDDVQWLVDSGAFTAWKGGRQINLDAYCKFLEGLPVRPWRSLVLDVVGDPVASRRNYDIMRLRGLNPMPVFTRGDALSSLDEYFETTDCVALGGVAGADKSAYAWLRATMNHAAKRSVHVLGFTSLNWIKFLRPYSCDSSTWTMATRYGKLQVWLGNGRMTPQLDRHLFSIRPPSLEIMEAIRGYGFEPMRLTRSDEWQGHHSMLLWIDAITWVKASLAMEAAIGTSLFLATTKLPMLVAAWRVATGQTTGEAERRRMAET